MMKMRGTTAVAALALALAGCGGGGGGSSGGPGGASSVTIDLQPVSTGPATQGVVVGTAPQDMRFIGHATGDVQRLVGNPIYVRVSGAQGLYSATPVIDQLDADGNLVMHVPGLPAPAAGDFTGSLVIEIAFDAAFTQPLGGMPVTVPYHVIVPKDLGVPASTLVVQTPFGTPAATQDVTVSLPAGVTSWLAATAQAYDDLTLPALVTTSAGADPATGIVHLQLAAMTPGVREFDIEVSADAIQPELPGNAWTYERTFHVQYTVAPSPTPDVWLWPSAPVFTIRQFDMPSPLSPRYRVVPNTGVSVALAGTTFLSAPAAEGSDPLGSSWWTVGPSDYITDCVFIQNSSPDCLVPGTFSARDDYDVTKGGVVSAYHVPISLTVTPAD